MGRVFRHLTTPKGRATRWSVALVAVLCLHGLTLLLFSRSTPLPPQVSISPIDILMYNPERPEPPPPPPAEPAVDTGGGGPASPSVIHRPPEPPPEVEREVIAPEEPAPAPEPEVGIAPVATPQPGQGLGGQGAGSGTGTGEGNGPGAGVRTGPRNLRQPRLDALRRYHPREALRRGVSGTAVVSCRIRQDTVLDQCRVLSETPAGQGFGPAGIAAAVAEYRFLPGMVDGRPDYDLRAVITIRFGRNAP